MSELNRYIASEMSAIRKVDIRHEPDAPNIFSLLDKIITANHLTGKSEDVAAFPDTIVVP